MHDADLFLGMYDLDNRYCAFRLTVRGDAAGRFGATAPRFGGPIYHITFWIECRSIA
jgi:hypothetical protein